MTRKDQRAARALSLAQLSGPPGGVPPVSLRSSADILALLERAAGRVEADATIGTAEFARLATYIAATAASVLKNHELEDRLAAIEERSAA